MAKKPNGRAKPKDTVKAKTRKAAPKKTIEQMSDQERQRLLLGHRRKLKPLLEDERIAKAAVTKAFALAEKEGFPKKEIKLAIALETDAGKEAMQKDIERAARLSRWLGAGIQLDMFGLKPPTKSEQLIEDGKRAALDDLPAKPPDYLNQRDAQVWLSGWSEARKEQNVDRVEKGFKTLGEAASGVIPGATESKVPPATDAYPPPPAGAEAVDSLSTH